ncbi:MAG: hypothetical protein ABJL67_13015 [Sulfitobacter sp.]
MGFEVEKELKNLIQRIENNYRDQNRVNQRAHDEIAKLAKTVQNIDNRAESRLGDQNKVNQRAHDEIVKTNKEYGNAIKRLQKDLDALAKEVKKKR